MAEPAPLSAYDRRLIAKTTLMRRRYRSSGYYSRLRSKDRGASGSSFVLRRQSSSMQFDSADLEGFRDSRLAESQRAAIMAASAFFPTELSGASLRVRKGANSRQSSSQVACHSLIRGFDAGILGAAAIEEALKGRLRLDARDC